MHRGSIHSQIVGTSAYKNVCIVSVLFKVHHLTSVTFEKDIIKLVQMDL